MPSPAFVENGVETHAVHIDKDRWNRKRVNKRDSCKPSAGTKERRTQNDARRKREVGHTRNERNAEKK